MIKSSVHPPCGRREGRGERSRWSSCDRRVTAALPWFIHELWRRRHPSRRDWETETSSERRRRCTLRLAQLVEDHNVVGVVEVFGQGLDVLATQSVSHEDSSPVSVRPVDTILEHRQEQKSQWSSSVKSSWQLYFDCSSTKRLCKAQLKENNAFSSINQSNSSIFGD